MASAEAAGTLELPLYTIVVDEAPKFDLRSYISAYKDRTVFRRLHLIASCSIALREEAAKLAVIEAKKGKDVTNYNAAVALLKSVVKNAADIEGLIEPNWPAEQEKRNAAETKRMENELKQYKNNLIRESIRMGNEDLGQHYHKTGDLGNAQKAFSRMREFCATSAHIASTAFLMIAVAIERKDWLAVQSQVHKIRHLQIAAPDQLARNQTKAAAAMGLQQMSLGDYREAASSFLNTDASLADGYNEVLTSNDVAVYGGLCALASMSRSELQTTVLDNANFRNFLELEPHIRRAITYFCASKYSQCLDILESYRADYLLDIYLQPQVDNIYSAIRTKSIVQYFQPFSKITLRLMEKMFAKPTVGAAGAPARSSSSEQTPVSSEFLHELATLIQSNLLPARIDLESQTLVAKSVDVRAQVQKEAFDTVDAFTREARIKLLRMAAMSAGVEVRRENREKGKAAASAMDLAGMSESGNLTAAGGGGTYSG